ncbi:cytochrome o ubiquinol oxidase subunit III [Blochmannia endosymbiont of Camponotus (Colobopsis) obliquus]|uniref:cytochrome o ubiquinol oxidase subunit III n=1 Tax=Blochmannia endosymbiont of Camponotus (Colobopsis) obliquus TaxID=1505597 RepID=UPI00061A8A42|nr:cytochrome o ubiquinol oxidase subunit III [Blochmannia endosymbiont of Camponotus (Colobopsis) obliquus]AKC60407.1 cytochrome o ubiquinol oxidase subunit 3 [Blochmannia endosymbiont of Camponotus (Colobopsis) obliquus]
MKKNNTENIKIFGFWIYLMSDCILFAALFISYFVLKNDTLNTSLDKEIFKIPFVFIETCCLLFSSLTYDIAILAIDRNNKTKVNFWLSITFLAGLSFICMEFYEFYHLIKKGYGPWYNAFFSGFFTLIGTHGIHVISGLIWIIIMMMHIMHSGLNYTNQIRLQCLSLFWHFLDIIWIIMFTVVYLLGIIP